MDAHRPGRRRSSRERAVHRGRWRSPRGGRRESAARYTLRSSDGTAWRWSEEAGVPRFEGVVGVPGSFIATWHDVGQVGLATTGDGATWGTIEGVPTMPEGPSVRDSDITTMEDRVVVVGWREGEEDPAKAAFALVGPLGAE